MFALALVLFLACIYGVTGRPAVGFQIKVSPAAQTYYLQIPPVLLPTQVQVNYTYTAVTVGPTVVVPTATVPAPTLPAFTLPTLPPPVTTTPASFRPTLPAATVPTPAATVSATVNVASQSVNCLGLTCFTLLPLVPYSYTAPDPVPYSDPLPYNYYWGWRGSWSRCYWFFC